MKLLVIEDEHKVANPIKRGLGQEGHTVDVAYEGTTGYNLASSKLYDVIILDLFLPEMDGMTICKRLRKEKNHTPILILIARDKIEDRIKGLDAGADDYLVKPFAFSELLARIRALGRRPKKVADSILKVRDLILDTSSFEVKRGGKYITLSKKEFSLLEYLMRHAGKILTKDQITAGVWSYDSNILPNTIEVYIGYLRNKIDRPFADKSPLIRTIRGFGYKIE